MDASLLDIGSDKMAKKLNDPKKWPKFQNSKEVTKTSSKNDNRISDTLKIVYDLTIYWLSV